MSDEGERLQKLLAKAGYGSRRSCEQLIADGLVKVNGKIAQLGQRALPTDTVTVEDVPVSFDEKLIYYLVNKPRGVVSTADDPQGRPTVMSIVPEEPRVFSVGRLDTGSEGLLLLTNDGDLAFRLTHPSFGVEKEYVVEVEGHPSAAAVRQLREGVKLDDGRTAPARVSRFAPNALNIAIHEGRNRQVRRMCEAVGHPVKRLIRTRIGPISDAKLKPGKFRRLSPAEIRSLQEQSGQPATR